MAALSSADKKNLNAQQQKQVAELKKQWEAANAAGDQAAMDAAHQQAEAIRNSAGYSGGSAGNSYSKVGANVGGQTAEEVRQWAENYNQTFYDPQKGWVNGYSTEMNTRSKANYIRQQMLANSQACHEADAATRDYLHQQNVELAKVLADYTGQSEKNYSYDPVTGKWSTWNPNLGYGEDKKWTVPGIVENEKKYNGVTDADIARWNSDTSHYFNFVDQSAVRKGIDESSGFTGAYSQFVNGPYAALLGHGSGNVNLLTYTDNYNDGWGMGEHGYGGDLRYDSNGNIIPQAPVVRNNQGLSDYSRSKAPYIENGVIQPNAIGSVRKGGLAHDYTGAGSGSGVLSGAGVMGGNAGAVGTGGTYDSYIQQMYAAILQQQLQQLEAAYKESLLEMDAQGKQVDAEYDEKKRQADSTAAQQAAIWRETANAYGLNSGAVGQATLAQSNRLQGDLNGLRAAQAAAQADLLQQRTALGQKYQAAIQQALAENNYEMANALYQEAVRAEEAMQKQMQFNANLALQYAKLAASMAKKA